MNGMNGSCVGKQSNWQTYTPRSRTQCRLTSATWDGTTSHSAIHQSGCLPGFWVTVVTALTISDDTLIWKEHLEMLLSSFNFCASGKVQRRLKRMVTVRCHNQGCSWLDSEEVAWANPHRWPKWIWPLMLTRPNLSAIGKRCSWGLLA